MLLSDEERDGVIAAIPLTGDDKIMAIENALLKAQLKDVGEELERQIGLFSRTAEDGRVWLPIDKFHQAFSGILEGINEETEE